ncbi:hypothetical protein C1646_773822 [Rhizophagus diaphanus]|nr:hypothetical protein C1646_773822 [Rhizophagus diaphanus] [Rhizophagus sp. MUCL 43196]
MIFDDDDFVLEEVREALGDENDFVLERKVHEALGDEDDFILEREIHETLGDKNDFVLKGDLKVLSVEDDFALEGDRKVSDNMLEPRIRKVPCFCSDCEGMLVAPRIKNRHELSSQLSSDISEVIIENTEIQDNELSEVLENTENINDESFQLTILNEQRVDRLPRKCRLRYILTRVSISNIGNIEQDLTLRESTAEDQSEDTNEDNESNDELNGDDELENSNSGTFENYSCPFFEPYQDSDVIPTPTNDDNNLYKARNILNIEDQFHSFMVCTKCHKLYNKQEVEKFRQDEILAIMKCQHIEFPNSSKCQKCQIPLSHQIRLLNKVSNRIEMIYPFSTIRQQLATLYLRSEFKKSLRHWFDRSHSENILTDIYDGQVWKTFKDTSYHDSPNFFWPEVADFHLGLMLNVDWF